MEFFLAIQLMYLVRICALGIFRHIDSGYPGGGGVCLRFHTVFLSSKKCSIYQKNVLSPLSLASLAHSVKSPSINSEYLNHIRCLRRFRKRHLRKHHFR